MALISHNAEKKLLKWMLFISAVVMILYHWKPVTNLVEYQFFWIFTIMRVFGIILIILLFAVHNRWH